MALFYGSVLSEAPYACLEMKTISTSKMISISNRNVGVIEPNTTDVIRMKDAQNKATY